MNSIKNQNAPFGSVLADKMSVARYRDGAWSAAEIMATGTLAMHPAMHALHYSSSCFEGFKAYKHADGSVKVFRLERHVERLRQSARTLVLPEPEAAQLRDMVLQLVDRCRGDVPDAPGALYLRPILFGTMPNIGAAATPSNEAMLVVLASPVWDYFAGGMKPLKIMMDDVNQRCSPHMGMVKTGGNYASAMGPTLAARKAHGTDQVLFCPGGEVQETGAANFLMLREGAVLTRSLDSTFLHGVTRDSLLTIARDLGYKVEERIFRIAEALEWARTGEAALSGTAAVLSGVGTLVYRNQSYAVGGGDVGPHTRKLRAALVAVQQGETPDKHGWLTKV
jgi:branched-chain amino acid aminotransferase